jgi:hypothetical protein
MKITNKANLPDPIYRAICNDQYTGGHAYASVTGLLKPTRMFWLQKRHYNEIEQDAADMIFMLMGSAMHSVLERGEGASSLIEQRFELPIGHKVVSGAVDCYENGIIQDYKFTSIWSWTYRSDKPEWEQQLNMYAYLCRHAGLPVKALQIICIFKDWSATKQKHDSGYPNQVEVIDIPLWDESRQFGFIEAKMNELAKYEDVDDADLPECPQSDRWQDPIKYAVKKKGNKKAKRLFDTLADAEDYLSVQKDDCLIETRESIPKRCVGYCSASGFCSWYQTYKQQEEE